MSDLIIKQAKPRDKRYTLSDGRGLILEVHSSETFADVALEWLRTRMLPSRKPGYTRTVKIRMEKYILPELGGLKLSAITSGMVLHLCRNIEAHGTIETAARVRQIVGQVFRYAVATDRANTDPQGIAALMRNIAAYPHLVVRCALWFSALTFCRPSEVRHAEWSEVDLDAKEWRIPAEKMKMGRTHIVPLARQAAALLEELREVTGRWRYVFPSARMDGRPMSENTVRGALLRLGKLSLERVGAVSENVLQEMAQEIVPIVAGELTKAISGHEFEHVSVEDAVNQVLAVGKETAQSTALLFTPGAVTQGIGIMRDVQQARSSIDAAAAGTTPEASVKAADGEAAVQGHPVDGLGKNAEPEAEGAETSVYLPVAALEQYAQTHPGELEDLGVDLTPLEGMDEVRLTEAQFASLSEELPELAEAVRNDVRRGAKGRTAREAWEIVMRRAERPAWRTAETDAVAEELEQKMLDVGKDREEARAFARVGASVAGMLARRANISPSDAMRLTLRRGDDARQGESFAQPVNAGVDLGQRVPVLDLSGAEGTSTTKELLTRLKDMALKDETWISRDAEVFATLPRGKKLKHVAYSSRKGDLRQRSNIASGLDELVQNAVLIESVPNNDPKKADVLNFHRLYVPVRTDAGVQAVRIVAEELKDSDRLRPTDVELYDVVLEGQKESLGVPNDLLAKEGVTTPRAPFDASISDSQDDVKQKESPAVNHGLLAEEVVPSPGAPSEITIADMLRGVKDAEGRPYVGEEYRQTAYHGSPVLYDKFDMSKVGSGNGTASYGWGANLSSVRDVAKMYALLAGGDPESVQVAKFDIPEDDVLLAYDKRFSEQPQKVKDALQPYADEYKQSDGERGIKIYDVFSGAQIQEKIADALNEGRISVPGGLSGPVDETSREVSMFLNSLGIPGLRYPDDSGNGYDFVIWDENVMHMLEREGGGKTETGTPAPQPSARQSEDYDPGDPKTWPAGPARDEALALEAWQDFEPDGEIEDWPESPEKAEALELQKEYSDIEAWFDEHSLDEVLADEEHNARGVAIEERLHELGRELKKQKPKGAERRLSQLIEAEEEAAAREAQEAENARIDAEDAEEYYQIIGKRGAKTLDAAEEGTTRLDNLNVAREMEQAAKDAKTIRLATGWERGADGKWRYEIPDGDLNLSRIFDTPEKRRYHLLLLKKQNNTLSRAENRELEAADEAWTEGNRTGQRFRLGDVYNAPELFAAYPDLADIQVRLYANNVGFGEYSHKHNRIIITLNNIYHPDAAEGLQFKNTLAHEIQHAIQEREGFQRGSNPLRAGGHEQYERIAGEVEARNAGRRVDMTEEDRKAQLLSETEDVAREDQIILEGMMDSEMAYSQEQLKIDPIASKYVKETESSRNVPIDKLHKTEPLDLDAAERARQKMQEAEKGGREKRSPLIVADRGDGTYSIIDGNNTFENLRELGARNVPVTIVPAPYQKHVTNLESLYARNAEVQTEFSDLLRSWQAEVGGELKMRKKLKSEERIREKVEADYNGEYHSVLDVLAGSLVFDSAEQMTEAFDKLKDKAEVVRIKNKWTHPDSTGYRDVNLNIRLSNGTLAELQLHHRGIMEAKDGLGHLLYEFIRKNKGNTAMDAYTKQAEEISRAVYDAGLRGTLPQRLANSMAQALDIGRRLSSQTSTRGPEALLSELSELILKTLSPASSEQIVLGKSSKNSTANGTSSPFSKYRNKLNTSVGMGKERNDRYRTDIPQSEEKINARLTVQSDGMSLIDFFENANRSTSFHELAHHVFRMLDELSRIEGADPQLRADVDEVLRHAGVTREDFDSEDADVRRQARTQAHEYFAQGFETYIAEGKAPSRALRGVFRRLRAWMIEVYHDVVQALGIELSPEVRDIYARLLATPEEITAETTVQELAVENAAIKEEIKRYQAELRERENEVKTAYREGVKAGREAEAENLAEFKNKAAERLAGVEERATRKLDKLKGQAKEKLDELEVKRRLQLGSEVAKAQMRIAALKQKLKERQEAKAEVGKLVKGINRMAGSETVTWAAHKEMEQLLSSYDLKRRSKKTLEHRAEVAQWLREDPELAEVLNEKDTAHLGETTLNEMTLDDLRALNERVQQIYDRGAEEYKIWDLERTERKDTIYTDLRDTLEKRKVNPPKVVTGPEDLKKQYKGLTGKAAKAKDWAYAVTLAKDRFFDWLDSGHTSYRGPFVKYFVDMTAAARGESLRHIQERRKWVEMRLRELGFRVSDFARIATTYNGKDYTWSEIQEIYMGLRNEKKAQAILNGNFKDSLDASGDTAYLVSLLSEEHKRAAELVAEDHNRNVDRVEAGMIAAYQKGMERETDYTSIHRLEHLSSMGLIDAESDEALMNGLSNADVLRRVEDGFMKKRVTMKAENQTPIHLGLWENWHSDVARHEHAAAMAVAARDLAGALLSRDPKSGKTLGKMVKERFGDEAWHTLVSFFNDDVMDDTRLAHNVLDRLSSTLAKNMSIAYLAGNLSTVLKQTTSIPRFLITAGPHRMLVSLGHFLLRGPKFLEEVYTMDPQLRERNGSPLLAMIREDPQWGKRMVQRGLDWLLEPISMVDRWVAAIGWKATYDANVKKLGHEGAVREAQRAVRLTQQPASARDTARMWRQNGFVRLAMVFTSDAASTFGMTAYDLVQQIRGGKPGRAFMTLTALAMTGILMKAANEGVPDDEDDDEEGRNWALEAFTEQAIASIPLAGKEAMVLYDSMRGKYRGTQYSAIMAPIVKLAQAYHLLSKEDSDEEDQRRATWLALEAFSLSGVAPIPVTGMRRIVQSFDLAKEDGMAAALNLVGIRRRPE